MFFPGLSGKWTAGVPFAGGDFATDGVEALSAKISARYPFLEPRDVQRFLRTYGTEAFDLFGDAQSHGDLGEQFGAGITAAELDWAKRKEWVTTAEDFLWRRTKLGLRLDADQIAWIGAYLETSSE